MSKPVLRLDLSDPKLFGNDAGEDEKPEVLASYFVENRLSKLFSDSKFLRIVRSRKGMGKSAMLSKLSHDLEKDASNRNLIVMATGADLIGLKSYPESMDANILQNFWKQLICTRINIKRRY